MGVKQELTLGWEEWLGLPTLGLAAIKAKVDTGAKTSALHASVIEPFGPPSNPQVRFLIQPDINNPKRLVTCSAPVIDQRNVTSSNNETELRYVISADVQIGDRTWPIEISLTNRDNMAHRMLLGRSAIGNEMIVDPNRSCVQPELSFDLYKNLPRKAPVQRPLRIALMTKAPRSYSSRRIAEAATARGHIIEKVNTSRCYIQIGSLGSGVHYDGRALPYYDAVIPRIGASVTAYGAAILRQFSSAGTYCLNSATAITSSRDKLLAHQLLARAGIDMPMTAFASSPKDTKDLIKVAGNAPVVVKLLESTQGRGVVLAETYQAAESLIDAFRGLNADFLVQEFISESSGVDTRCFVIGRKVVGAMRREAPEGEFRSNLHRGGTAHATKLSKAEKTIARNAAKELGLAVAGVDIVSSHDGPKVLEVNSSPGLEGIEAATGKDVATMMIEYLESRVRTLSPQRDKRRTGLLRETGIKETRP